MVCFAPKKMPNKTGLAAATLPATVRHTPAEASAEPELTCGLTLPKLRSAALPAVVVLGLQLCMCPEASPASVGLAWDPNPDSDGVVEYNLYKSHQSGVFPKPPVAVVPASASPQVVVSGLLAGEQCFFMVTALNTAGESGPSNTVLYQVPEESPQPIRRLRVYRRASLNYQPKGGELLASINWIQVSTPAPIPFITIGQVNKDQLGRVSKSNWRVNKMVDKMVNKI